MTQPAKVQEPSMEEILASIRRIIADDEAKPPVAEKAAAPAARRETGKTRRSRGRREASGDERDSSVRHSRGASGRCQARRCTGAASCQASIGGCRAQQPG